MPVPDLTLKVYRYITAVLQIVIIPISSLPVLHHRIMWNSHIRSSALYASRVSVAQGHRSARQVTLLVGLR